MDVNENIFRSLGGMEGRDVFNYWRLNEAGKEHWIEYWKAKGFGSWEEWRKNYATEFKLWEREWLLCRILNPLGNIPFLRGGPLRSWVENYYRGLSAPTVDWIVRENIRVESNPAVVSIAHDFPRNSFLTGLCTKEGVRIIEGMHRCCAAAVMKIQKAELDRDVFICLASAFEEELPVVGGFTAD